MEDYVGRTLGNYEVQELIGRGGMAAVYKGYQPSMNRHVAIKVMLAHVGMDETFVRRFRKEAEVIASLEHAHILPVHDFGEEEGTLYLVMRYLEGGTLGDQIPPDGMEPKEAQRLLAQIAPALDYAHKQGVIHRDLKPGNILIDKHGDAYLTDFGIVKLLNIDERLTGTDAVIGTPTYMPPEQGMGETVDARSDIYALGVVLFEMLTGETPFEADNPMALMLKHINEPAPRPSAVKPSIPSPIDAVVLQALAKDPNMRYQTATEMAEALGRALLIARGATPLSLKPAEGPPSDTMPIAGAPTRPAPERTEPIAGTSPSRTRPAGVLVDIKLNAASSWLAERETLGVWLQAAALSLATFFMLQRLTAGNLLESAVLALLPGVVLYGLLRAPTLGGLSALILVLIPLLVHAPGIGIIWAGVAIIAGATLNSREIMLTLVTLLAAGFPFGWLVPLLVPWWLRARRTLLPAALGVILAVLFAATLGWPNAGGLLPTPPLASGLADQVVMTPFSETNYINLFEPATWSHWRDFGEVWQTIRGTFGAIGKMMALTSAAPLLLAAAWANASVLSVSNRRVQSPVLRAMGLGLGLVVLIAAHLVALRAAGGTLPPTSTFILAIAGAAILSFGFSQWPIQADPNAGNRAGTVQRLLRQSLGAVFMALGVGFFATQLEGAPFYDVLWIGGVLGTLIMLTNPLFGPPLVFAALAVAFMPDQAVKGAVMLALLVMYFIVNLFFDIRRPRRWNPLGAGLMLGAPGIGQVGLLALGPLSMGALESQVPAAVFAVATTVTMVLAAKQFPGALAVVVQVVTPLMGVLLVERLMGIGVLKEQLPAKLRRLLFTAGAALLASLLYYSLGRVAPGGFAVWKALLIGVVTAAMLVGAMGDRAAYWRRFIEREEVEEEDEDDEITRG